MATGESERISGTKRNFASIIIGRLGRSIAARLGALYNVANWAGAECIRLLAKQLADHEAASLGR